MGSIFNPLAGLGVDTSVILPPPPSAAGSGTSAPTYGTPVDLPPPAPSGGFWGSLSGNLSSLDAAAAQWYSLVNNPARVPLSQTGVPLTATPSQISSVAYLPEVLLIGVIGLGAIFILRKRR